MFDKLCFKMLHVVFVSVSFYSSFCWVGIAFNIHHLSPVATVWALVDWVSLRWVQVFTPAADMVLGYFVISVLHLFPETRPIEWHKITWFTLMLPNVLWITAKRPGAPASPSLLLSWHSVSERDACSRPQSRAQTPVNSSICPMKPLGLRHRSNSQIFSQKQLWTTPSFHTHLISYLKGCIFLSDCSSWFEDLANHLTVSVNSSLFYINNTKFCAMHQPHHLFAFKLSHPVLYRLMRSK